MNEWMNVGNKKSRQAGGRLPKNFNTRHCNLGMTIIATNTGYHFMLIVFQVLYQNIYINY